jgi:hypothetical protein
MSIPNHISSYPEGDTSEVTLTDSFGRVWALWRRGFTPIYRHDQMAWTEDQIMRPGVVLPSVKLRDNPNYDLCEICRQEWDD